jgi:hypothetical protein
MEVLTTSKSTIKTFFITEMWLRLSMTILQGGKLGKKLI